MSNRSSPPKPACKRQSRGTTAPPGKSKLPAWALTRTSRLRLDMTADLVTLDNLAFDQETLNSEVEVFEENDEIDLSSLTRMSEDAPVVRLVNVLLVDALRRGASDIHVEPYEKELRIRFRIDGVLYDVMHPPLKMRDALISRIKIMSKLDISEKRPPQDG